MLVYYMGLNDIVGTTYSTVPVLYLYVVLVTLYIYTYVGVSHTHILI